MIEKVGIEEFLKLAKRWPVFDVRSPGEYCHAHISGAYSLPLFSDEERKIVGTIYKQQSREDAIKIGLDFFGVKMKNIVIEAEKITQNHKSLTSIGPSNEGISSSNSEKQPGTILIHCWRGGMRSAGIAWLLDLYGFKVYTLVGGYKAYRHWVLQQFEQPYPFKMLGGYTGSGKTEVLKELAKNGHPVIDLEGIACHKGSAFGALGEAPQPTQEMFENELATKLHAVSEDLPHGHIWLEDESRRIGSVNIPNALWCTIRQASLYFLDIPFEERLDHITEEYGQFDKPQLVSCILRIQKRLGGKETKDAINFLKEGNYRESFRMLLCYYDKFYAKDIDNRSKPEAVHESENSQELLPPGGHFKMKKIICETVDETENSRRLINAEK
jgi:tRNA 2-selenouridine synthase